MPSVLIVDDDDRTAVALGARLKAGGFEPVLAYDVPTAVTLAAAHQPSLVILDIAMPQGGGFALAQRLRRMPATASTPILFITASRHPGLMEHAMERGAAGYIEKPYDPRELLALVRDLLTGQEEGNAAQQ